MSSNVQNVIIRDAEEWEADMIAEVMVEAYGQYALTMPPDRWEEYRESIKASVYGSAPVARLIALTEGNIVGSVQMFHSSESAYGKPEMGIHSPIIRLLAVSPAARGLGIATLLIQEAARRSIQLGASTLNLHTSDMMASAVKLYERLGFKRAFDTDIWNGDTLVKGYRIEAASLLGERLHFS
ncbi:GNAT family N-acetyltransferase [Paenibacillus sp. FSL H7-0326]|uniref:GNAT family N-acetyltransferase n=1 Tax=Paenibacillus sp. FSL H7-0326 TaxID=1921144 RepID=UPI00096C2780|nr:GNAT family N-acetyltransferase [Paenibacillus sp. FSL H7-0326]OMC67142.1 GNAT family N-acetyltransferase [Paenibacillus sp. FSL H7-0326]